MTWCNVWLGTWPQLHALSLKRLYMRVHRLRETCGIMFGALVLEQGRYTCLHESSLLVIVFFFRFFKHNAGISIISTKIIISKIKVRLCFSVALACIYLIKWNRLQQLYIIPNSENVYMWWMHYSKELKKGEFRIANIYLFFPDIWF